MFDTIKIILYANDVDKPWDVEEVKNKLEGKSFVRNGKKKTLLRNMAVYVDKDYIFVDGSIAKYLNMNNIEVFDFRNFPLAIRLLSDELGIDLRKAKIRRLDIASNIELNEEVSDYFPELYSLKYYQRDSGKKTTLRFFSNSDKNNLVFYDKVKEFAKKNNGLIGNDTSLIDTFGNLLRYELAIQKNPSKYLKIKDLRVEDMFKPENCKKALRFWFDKYNKIHKKSLLEYPNIKGLKGFENLMKRYLFYSLGRERIEFLLKKAIDKKLISASDKSKKLKQFDIVLSSKIGFEFKEKTRELDHKMKVHYVEGLKQIFKMEDKESLNFASS